MKILVVDDFRAMRDVICHILRAIGFNNIQEASDGAQAFNILKKVKYDFVVSDWNMPKVTGIELLKKIRNDEDLKDLPVLLVTAENERSQVIEAAKAGVNSYIVKPFNALQLKEKIKIIFPDYKFPEE